MRKLATIRKISDIKPIEGADRIELALVDGWQCVVKKGEFKVNDLCLYIEIDSVLPEHEVFEFMRERRYRVRTIKLRKQISQGLVMPLEILDKFKPDLSHKVLEGDDVTELLGIKLYDSLKEEERKYSKKTAKPLNPVTSYFMSFAWFRKLRYLLGFKRLKNFPTHLISKTDEDRVQNLPNFAKIYKNRQVIFTEKLDGSSASYLIHKSGIKNHFYVCSRNINLHKKTNSIWWQVAEIFKIEEKLKRAQKELKFNIGIQGEIIGPKVQDNKYKLDKLDFYIFNVVNLDKNYRFNFMEKLDFCKKYNFKYVPIIPSHPFPFVIKENMTVEDMLAFASSKSMISGGVPREGIVIRSLDDDRQSFKAINNAFLIKYNM